MTTPAASLPALATPPSVPRAAERGTQDVAADDGKASFSKVLDKERGRQAESKSDAAGPKPAQESAPGKAAGLAARDRPAKQADDAQAALADAARSDAALATAAQDLPRQALDIAMQAAAQLHGLKAEAGADGPADGAVDKGDAVNEDGAQAPRGLAAALPAARGNLPGHGLPGLALGAALRGDMPAAVPHEARDDTGILPAQPAAPAPVDAAGREAVPSLSRIAHGLGVARQPQPTVSLAGQPVAQAEGVAESRPVPSSGQDPAALVPAAQAIAPTHSALLAAQHEAAALASLAGGASPAPGAPAGHAAPAQTAGVQGPYVSAPLGHPQWGAELGRQLVMITQSADGARHTAELRLDPPDLGPLRVSISLSDGVAQAAFVSPHAAVRQAVESSLAQLQQALAQAGISLGQASVSDQPAQQDGRPAGGAPETGGATTADVPDETPALAARPVRSDALVDTFA